MISGVLPIRAGNLNFSYQIVEDEIEGWRTLNLYDQNGDFIREFDYEDEMRGWILENYPTYNYDPVEREYILDHGGWFDDKGMAVIARKDWNKEQYKHKSVRDPSIWAWMIPCWSGQCILFEGKHFRIE